MIFELPTAALVVLNVAAWPLIHLGVAYAATRRSAGPVNLDSWLLRERRFEDHGRFYERTLRITRRLKEAGSGGGVTLRCSPSRLDRKIQSERQDGQFSACS